MKLYKVINEEYYDDFSDGGVFVKEEKLYVNKANALKKLEEIKEKIKSNEEYSEILKKIIRYNKRNEYDELQHPDYDIILLDCEDAFAIKDDSSMCYWGEGVFIMEITTED